jgi:hypothetical protein
MSGSILVVCYDSSSGQYIAQKAGSDQIADNAITSGKLGSGVIGLIHFAPFTSGQVILGQGAGAPIYGFPPAGAVGDETVTSGKLASGAVIGNRVADFGLVSGKYASGSITGQALASGTTIDIAEIIQETTYLADAPISSYLGVQFSTSGYFNYTQAGAVGTMPAIGISVANILSGAIGIIQTKGRVTNTVWDFSGYIGKLVFTGVSSEVTVTAPSASGQCIQRLGKVIGGQTVYLSPDLTFMQLAQ